MIKVLGVSHSESAGIDKGWLHNPHDDCRDPEEDVQTCGWCGCNIPGSIPLPHVPTLCPSCLPPSPLFSSSPLPSCQMHYTNPSRSSTIIDNSGISLGVTSQLQTNEAAITTTGPVFEQFLIRVPAMRVRAQWGEKA